METVCVNLMRVCGYLFNGERFVVHPVTQFVYRAERFHSLGGVLWRGSLSVTWAFIRGF